MKNMKFRQALIDRDNGNKFVDWRYWGVYENGWHPPSLGKDNWFKFKALTPEELEAMSFMCTGKIAMLDRREVYDGDIVTAVIPHQGGRLTNIVVSYDHPSSGFVYRDINFRKIATGVDEDYIYYTIANTVIEEITGNIVQDIEYLKELIVNIKKGVEPAPIYK